MSKKDHKDNFEKGAMLVQLLGAERPDETSVSHEDCKSQRHMLEVEVVKLQRHFIGCGDKILVLLARLDAAGDDGGIKRVVEYLSPHGTRVVVPGRPFGHERRGWYIYRSIAQLLVAEKLVLFNRSWFHFIPSLKIAALSMSSSSALAAINTLLLKRTKLTRIKNTKPNAAATPAPTAARATA